MSFVLDGSERVDNILKNAVLWDVMAGVARAHGRETRMYRNGRAYNQIMDGKDILTLPYIASDELIERTLSEA